MILANPLFLVGLVALAIPVIIHLVNFRRYRKVYFTNVRFLSAVRQESQKRSELKRWLILLCRLLAISSLVLAFAQPYRPSSLLRNKKAGIQVVSIYVDNSLSMEATNGTGSLFETAIGKAVEIAKACNPSDQFILTSNEPGNRTGLLLSRDEFIDAVKDLDLSPVSENMSTTLMRMKESAGYAKAGNRLVYLISDFQQTTADLADFPPDSVTSYILVPLKPGLRKNLCIDSAWLESPVQQPGQPSVMNVALRNTGPETVEKVPLKLTINGKQKAVAGVRLEAESETEIPLHFTNEEGGWQSGTLELLDFPVTFDNTLYFSFPLVHALRVLAVHPGTGDPYLQALYGGDSTFSYSAAQTGQLDYSSLSGYPVLLLNGLFAIPSGLSRELTRFLENGGHLVLFPPRNLDLASYHSFFQTLNVPSFSSGDTIPRKVDYVNLESNLFSDVFEKDPSGRVTLPENADLPVAFFHYSLVSQPAPAGSETLLRLENGDPFLSVFPAGNGRIYLFTSPLNPAETDFPRHPVFVPVMYRIALLSTTQHRLFYCAGSNEPISIRGGTMTGTSPLKIRKEDGSFEVIPEIKNIGNIFLIYPHGQVREAGQYSLYGNDSTVTLISFNLSRAESDPGLHSSSDLLERMAKAGIPHTALLRDSGIPVQKQVRELQQGKPLWKIFILLTLFFIGSEIALIRILK